MKEELYKRNIIEHYKNPKNFSKLEKYDSSACVSNITCGDELEVFLQIQDNVIKDISFQGSGCAISLASMSMLSERVKGMDLDEVRGISEDEILQMLGMQKETPRIKCALLGLEALRKAI